MSDVRREKVAHPKLVDANDVLLRITTSAVCGSDLHQYHGREGALIQKGALMGHEFMGVVEETGAVVRGVRAGESIGERVFRESCGQIHERGVRDAG
ncbi:MAG: alcohol dehydrogenase catalytic domain-containing protein [Candidatus Rokuibacteriota bacterium]